MSRKEGDFLKRLLVTFQGEAEERVRSLASGLIELEKSPEADKQSEIVELVFREVHSLKGAARAVNLVEIEAICQALEDVFSALKQQTIVPSLALLDALHHATDVLMELLLTSQAQPIRTDRTRHIPLIRQLKELAKSNAQSALAIAPPDVPITEGVPSPVVLPEAPADPMSDSALEKPKDRKASEIEGASAQPLGANSEWHLESTTQPFPRPLLEERATPTAETVRISTSALGIFAASGGRTRLRQACRRPTCN